MHDPKNNKVSLLNQGSNKDTNATKRGARDDYDDDYDDDDDDDYDDDDDDDESDFEDEAVKKRCKNMAESDDESDEWFLSRIGGSMKRTLHQGRRKNHEFWNSYTGFYEEVPTHLQKGRHKKARYSKQSEVSEEEQHEWFRSRKGGPKKQGKGTHNRKRHLYWNSHTGENDPIPEELQVREEERIPGDAERSETGEGARLAPHTL